MFGIVINIANDTNTTESIIVQKIYCIFSSTPYHKCGVFIKPLYYSFFACNDIFDYISLKNLIAVLVGKTCILTDS